MTTDTQGISSSAPSAADAAYASSGGRSTGFGLNAAISGILALSDSLQALTGAVAAWATTLSGFVSDASEQNAEQADANNDALAALGTVNDDMSDTQIQQLQTAQTNQQSKTQKDNTVGQATITTAQWLADLVENSMNQLSSGNSMLISILGQIVSGLGSIRIA